MSDAAVRTRTILGDQHFTAAATVLNLLISLPLAYYLNVWEDDAYTLHTTSGSLPYAWQQSTVFEQNAPFYFLLLTLWRQIDPSYFFARLLSVLCVVLVIFITPKLVRRYLPQLAPRWIVVAVALNPFMIWASVEIRLYALAMLLGGLLLLAFYDGFLASPASRSARIWYMLVSIVAAYTQYFLICLIVAQGVVLLFRNRKAFVAYFLGQLVVVTAFIPMLLVIPSQLQSFRIGYTPPHSIWQSGYIVSSILGTYLLGFHAYPNRQIFYGIAGVVAIAALIAIRKWFTPRGAGTLPIVTIVAAVLLAIIIFAEHEHIINRHAAFMFVPMTLSVYAILTFIREPVRSRAVVVWSCIAILVGLGCSYFTYRSLAKPGDWERVAAFISATELPNEPILVFETEDTLPFSYYYHGPNRIVGVPREIDYTNYDVSKFVIHSAEEMDRAVAAIPRGHPFWFIVSGWCENGTTAFGCDVVEGYIEQRLATLADHGFYGSRVRLVKRK